MTAGSLYIVSTPIGNLSDFTTRAKDILESVDLILAEDPRVTMKLLNHLGLKKKIYPYSDHASDEKHARIVETLQSGQSYALVSDAGTPVISDPGLFLVEAVLAADLAVIPIPGPSAVTALASVFGRPFANFHFWGFFPQKNKKRRELVQFIDTIPGLHIFFESPYRVEKVLEGYFAERSDFYMVVGREMTKQFETFYRGSPSEVLAGLREAPIKGEFCVGIIKLNQSKDDQGSEED